MTQALSELWSLAEELQHLGNIQGVLGWDMETRMPPKGAENRAKQLATLSKISHDKWTDAKLGELLSALEANTGGDLTEFDRGLVRVMRREYDQACKLPGDLVKEMAETEALAHGVWVEARKNNRFADFAPVLQKIVDQKRRMANALGYTGSPYNALLDLYEPDLTTEMLDPLFAKLKQDLVPLIRAIKKQPVPDDDFLTRGPFDVETQRTFTRDILKAMGFDFGTLRLEDVPHPCCSGTGPGDLAIGTRFMENDLFSGISSTIHEGGHGLYDLGVDPAIAATPLSGGASLGIHESQSRMWENLVGRSRAFWSHYFPQLQARFPEALKDVSLDRFYQAINRVQPSLIRVEADEATYNLHVLLRYEIEKDVIEGRLAVSGIPEAWNQKMQDYLGLTPPDDARGCLQDVHWSMGGFGYFPTYTLGNLYAVQFYRTAQQQIPDLENRLSQGELLPLKTWLNEQIHRVSRAETPTEIVQRVTGEPLNPQYFTEYLWEKFGALYNLQRPAVGSVS